MPDKKSSKAEPKKTTRIKAKDTSPVITSISVDDIKSEKKHAAPSKPLPERKCKLESCKREYKAKGYCKTHYREWRHGKFGNARYTACSDIGCFKPMATNRFGYCETHYQAYYVKGLAPKTAAPAEEKADDSKEKVA